MNQQVSELIAMLPDPDEQGLMSNIDENVVDGVTAQVINGAPDSIVAVVDMLKGPGTDDYKAHYALHCVAIRAGNDEKVRQKISAAIAGCLDKDYPAEVRKYLIRELQLAGGKEVTDVLGAFLNDDDLCEPAAQALAAIKTGALEQFKKALPRAGDKCRPTIRQNIELLETK